MSSIKYAPVISLISIGIGAWLGTRYERKYKLKEITESHNDSVIERDYFVSGVRESFAHTKTKLIDAVKESKHVNSIKERIDSLRINHENSHNDVEALFHRFIPTLDAASILVPVGQLSAPTPCDPRKFQAMTRHGLPSAPTNIRTYDEFILSYDNRTRNPVWVFEHLTKDDVTYRKEVKRDGIPFVEDLTIHKFYRAANADFSRSGYDRGHMAAAANHRTSMSAMSQTFLLTNICPQVGVGFNRDAWNTLETSIRSMTKSFKNIYICTGPLYLPSRQKDKLIVSYEVIGEMHIAVPTHFFKVVLGEKDNGEFELRSYVMENKALNVKSTDDLVNYLVPIEAIERASGLCMFDKLKSSLTVSRALLA